MKFFGLTAVEDVIESFDLSNKNGMKLTVINYGATVVSLKMPLKTGEVIDVVLGFDNLEAYLKSFHLKSPPYFGATVGRFAGRINNRLFNLNGKPFLLNKNNNNHSLHGGIENFSQKIWIVENINEGENPSITLSYLSPDEEENYPGDLSVKLTYILSEENELIIEYQASSSEDTIVNLTHHSYFNLDGHKSDILKQELMVNSKKILETTNENIPTGKFLDISDSSFDFSNPKKCPSEIDTTFVFENNEEFAASLFSKNNMLKMTVYTDQPGIHIYVGGNCFNIIKGKENVDYHSLSGICFETQNFPDAPNHKHFPSPVLKKGEIYHHKTIYKFQSF
ncbi:galactose mutarotase [Flavobacterium soyangense]|uniref:Aldose 1-epimerase n=2 Tax=Flavobacterium soyangense TaxID=2023265 RepID=A0A930U917_9FLAO|nr:galactose mutarotase [Flavobacterium soyangense]